MDPGSLSLRVIMVCLLGAARCSNGGDITCPCREISPLPLTEPPPQDCLHSRFRYTCLDGYLRKVGTSNLIKCTQQKIGGPKWSTPTLVCIADPKRTTTPTPERTVAKGPTDIPPDISTSTTITSSIPNTIKSASTSASEATETNSATSASPGVQSEHSQVNFKETKATAWTTSTSTSTSTSTTPTTTTEPFNDTTHKADVHTSPRLGPTIPAVIICFSLLIVCALIGLRYICYRRRSRNNNPPATEEEKVAMSPVSLE